jgi:hypothetical protein
MSLAPRRRQPLVVACFCVCLCGAALLGIRAQVVPDTLPAELGDKEFWSLVADFSEPDGFFRSDNLVSNERAYQQVVPELKRHALPNGVYLGVGPDQNFTYISALHPRMAFIVDIRRGNLLQQLFYKALVEMSDDRADFLARLFSRERPYGIDSLWTAGDLLDAFEEVEAGPELFQKNLADIQKWLTGRHGFVLTEDDLRGIEYVARAFFSEGPSLRYSFPSPRLAPVFPTYADLMTADDGNGVNHGYLASETNFRALRDFERRNLLVPIVGDFAGEKALRAVGRYIGAHGGTVNYFYTSNVEQYLFQNDAYKRYYANVATLPLAEKSTFIRSFFDRGFIYPPGVITPDLHSVQLLDSIQGLLKAFNAGEITSYQQVVAVRTP